MATWTTPHTAQKGKFLTAPNLNEVLEDEQYLYDLPLLKTGVPSLTMPFEQRAFGKWEDAAYVDVSPGTWLFLSAYAISTPDQPGGGGQNGAGRIQIIDDGGVGTLTESSISWFKDAASLIFAVRTFTAVNTRINTQIVFDEGGQAPWPRINYCTLYALRIAL